MVLNGSLGIKMHLYAGFAVWSVIAFVLFKVVNGVVYKRQLAGELSNVECEET